MKTEVIFEAERLICHDCQQPFIFSAGERPDLVIMDIQLPKINGLEVTRKLREDPAFSYLPIIGVTAYSMEGDRERVLEAGCDAYLSKPISTRELPRIIAEILSQRLKGGT